MAAIVAGFGVPHTPTAPHIAKTKGPDCTESVRFAEVARHLEAANPDAIVIFANDHFNTFFFDNFPLLAVGVAESTSGPNDRPPMPQYENVPVQEALAEAIRAHAIGNDFDVAVTQEFRLDHAFMVPWHFLNAERRVPIVPFFIHGFSNPLPNATRAWALGETLREAIEGCTACERVAVIASGSFSLEIGGPLADVGERSGTPDIPWTKHVIQRMENCEIEELIEEATGERMARAGNAAGELLNWIAMLGVIGAPKPNAIQPRLDHGDAFGIWRLE